MYIYVAQCENPTYFLLTGQHRPLLCEHWNLIIAPLLLHSSGTTVHLKKNWDFCFRVMFSENQIHLNFLSACCRLNLLHARLSVHQVSLSSHTSKLVVCYRNTRSPNSSSVSHSAWLGMCWLETRRETSWLGANQQRTSRRWAKEPKVSCRMFFTWTSPAAPLQYKCWLTLITSVLNQLFHQGLSDRPELLLLIEAVDMVRLMGYSSVSQLAGRDPRVGPGRRKKERSFVGKRFGISKFWHLQECPRKGLLSPLFISLLLKTEALFWTVLPLLSTSI